MRGSGQPGNGGKQDGDLVMFVSSVELIGRCMKGEFERDKPRTTGKPISIAFWEQYLRARRMSISLGQRIPPLEMFSK